MKIFAETLGLSDGRVVAAAAASELIHAASLLHDDVVDAGMFRRGRPTVNARWGNVVAVMGGDLLLSRALLHLSGVDARLTSSALATVAEMTTAAIAEVEARGNLDLAIPELEAIFEGKTGALFGWCGRAAATLADDADAARRFDAFGRRIGVAFQVADDIRDLSGTDDGKPQFADLRSRTASLPVLLAASSDPALRRRIADAWHWSAPTADRVRELGAAVLVSGAIERAIELMERQIAAAVDELGPYGATASGASLISWARAIAHGLALRRAA